MFVYKYIKTYKIKTFNNLLQPLISFRASASPILF